MQARRAGPLVLDQLDCQIGLDVVFISVVGLAVVDRPSDFRSILLNLPL